MWLSGTRLQPPRRKRSEPVAHDLLVVPLSRGEPGPARLRALTYVMMYGMKRTTVYLPDELKAALERAAAATGTSEAEIVRGAIAAATVEHAYPPPRVPLFSSGDSTLAERVDEALAEGFGE